MSIYEARYEVEGIDDDTELTPEFRDAWATWRSLCGDGDLPTWSVTCFLEFPQKLLPLAIFAAREPASEDFRIRYWGSRRYDLYNADYTGELVTDVGPPCVGEKLRGEYAAVVAARRPLKLHSYLKTHTQGDIHIYKLRLPFTRDGEDVDGILTLEDAGQMTRRLFLATTGEPPNWASEDTST